MKRNLIEIRASDPENNKRQKPYEMDSQSDDSTQSDDSSQSNDSSQSDESDDSSDPSQSSQSSESSDSSERKTPHKIHDNVTEVIPLTLPLQMEATPLNFKSLPHEILEKIIIELSYCEIVMISEESPYIRDFLKNNSYFWTLKGKKDFPQDYPNPMAIYRQVAQGKGIYLPDENLKRNSNKYIESALISDDPCYVDYLITHEITDIYRVIYSVTERSYDQKFSHIIRYILKNPWKIELSSKHIGSFIINAFVFQDYNLVREIYQQYPHLIIYKEIFHKLTSWSYKNKNPSILTLLLQMGNIQKYVTFFYKKFKRGNYNIKEIKFLLPIFERVNLTIDPNVILHYGIIKGNKSLINLSLKYGVVLSTDSMEDVSFPSQDIIYYINSLINVYQNHDKISLEITLLSSLSRNILYFSKALYILINRFHYSLKDEVMYLYWATIKRYKLRDSLPMNIRKILKGYDNIVQRTIEYNRNYPNLNKYVNGLDIYLKKSKED